MTEARNEPAESGEQSREEKRNSRKQIILYFAILIAISVLSFFVYRIYDFVCGCCVALDCKLEKVSREVYIATPYNAKVYKLDDKDQVQLTEDAYSFN